MIPPNQLAALDISILKVSMKNILIKESTTKTHNNVNKYIQTITE